MEQSSSPTREGLLLLAQQGLIVTNRLDQSFQLTKLPFAIRLATLADLDQLLLIEKECWKHLHSSREELLRRLRNAPNDQFVAEIRGVAVGVMYTQKILSVDILKEEANFENQTNFHDPSGTILQLLGVAVLPEYGSMNISFVLRDFVLSLAKCCSKITSVIAMTRCSNKYGSEACYFTHFREDPTVLFHVNAGAQIVEIIKNYRPRDTTNYGHSVLIKYTLQDDFEDFDFDKDEQSDKLTGLEFDLPRDRQYSQERSIRLRSDERETREVSGDGGGSSKKSSDLLSSLLNLAAKEVSGKGVLCPEEEMIAILNNITSSSPPITESHLHTPFMDLGLDSLQMIELRNHLLHHYNLPEAKFPPTVLFDYSTPSLLLQFINSNCSTQISSQPIHPVKPVTGTRRRSESGTGLLLPDLHATALTRKEEGVFICGMSCRLPGGANHPDLFYQLLMEGKTTFSPLPKDWLAASEEEELPGYASFLDETVASSFDPNFFGISVNEAQLMDPHQKIMLELAHEALTDAGLLVSPLSPTTRVGVFVGACNNEWIAQTISHATADTFESPYLGSCVAQSSIANRISYCLGLHGPSMVIDTACSSSLYALHVAIQSLERGDCDFALVAAVDLLLSPLSLKLRDVAGMLSRNDRIRAFGEGADGYIRGEGAIAFVLGRSTILSHSTTTPIYAKILGSVVNHDGRSASFTAPNGVVQRTLLQDALEKARIRSNDFDLLECHGTGTKLGDPIEWTAIKEVYLQPDSSFMFDSNPLVLSAVKSNIGHLEGAAGLVGLLKAVLAVYHGTIPKSPEGIEISPFIDIKHMNAREVKILPTEHVHLRPNAIAGISSFGSGGSNSHVLIQASQIKRANQRKQIKTPLKIAFVFSGQGGLTREVARDFYLRF